MEEVRLDFHQMGITILIGKFRYQYWPRDAGLFLKADDVHLDNPDWKSGVEYVLEHRAELTSKWSEWEDYYWRKANEEQFIPLKRNKKGFVYVLHSERGEYKIGCTKSLDKRLTGLKLPFKIYLDLAIHSDDCRQLELELHCQFESLRINGEWFSLGDEHIRTLKTVFSERLVNGQGVGEWLL